MYWNSEKEATGLSEASVFSKMNVPIKITYMIDVLDTDLAGTENQLIKMINGLDKKKFQVQLICLADHPWFKANGSSLDCSSRIYEIRQFKKPSSYINFLRLVRYFRDERPDILHTFFPVSNIVGVLAARLAGVKNIISSRRDYGEWMNGSYLFSTKVANRFVKKVITNSNMVKRLTLEREGVPDKRVDVIYNGIDADLFQGIKRDYHLKSQLNIPENHKVVGIVANFRPMKHHETFVKAANEVLKNRKDVTFLLLGTGPTQDNTKKLAGSLQILQYLRFAGQQKEIIPYLSIMDIGVNCSEAEGLSNAIMEYMASKIPCIVSKSGGNTDLISDSFNGYIFPLDDYQTMSKLILILLDDAVIRERFIKNAIEKIRNEMSLDVIILKYQALYEGLKDG